MRSTTTRLLTAGALLVIAGTVLTAASRFAFASHGMPHGTNASGVPYWPGAAQLSKNFTFYVTEFSEAISRWNNATTDRDYLLQTTDSSQMRQYMVYSGSGQDLDLAAWFDEPSCKWWTDNYAFIRDVPAFMFGHTPLNGDNKFTVICLNVSSLGYPNAFDDRPQETRVKGIAHEMGHSLHLAHDSGFSIMNTCWCYDISSHDAGAVQWIYASAP